MIFTGYDPGRGEHASDRGRPHHGAEGGTSLPSVSPAADNPDHTTEPTHHHLEERHVNTTTMTDATVPLSPSCPPWCELTREEHQWATTRDGRAILDHSRDLPPIETANGGEVGVWVAAEETPDHGIGAPFVGILAEGEELTPTQARRFARRLLEAADILEGTGGSR